MKTKQFLLGHVLSVTTGRLVCEGEKYPIDGIYSILNHATGESLYTHVLPRACKFAAPLILAQYSELEAAGCDMSLSRLDALIEVKGPAKAIHQWLNELGLQESYAIECYADQWQSLNPLDELAAMVGDKGHHSCCRMSTPEVHAQFEIGTERAAAIARTRADIARAVAETRELLAVKVCPSCGSTEVEPRHHAGSFALPECFFDQCGDCGNQFNHS